MNNPKVFKLGVGNELGVSYKWYGFGVESSKVRVNSECLLVSYWPKGGDAQ